MNNTSACTLCSVKTVFISSYIYVYLKFDSKFYEEISQINLITLMLLRYEQFSEYTLSVNKFIPNINLIRNYS